MVVGQPIAGIVNDAGDDIASYLTSSQIVMTGDPRYETSLADPGVLKYPESAYAPLWVAEDFSAGALAGVGEFTYALGHGLLVDLPTLAVKGLAALPTVYMAMMNLDAQVWKATADDPALRATYLGISPVAHPGPRRRCRGPRLGDEVQGGGIAGERLGRQLFHLHRQ